LVKWYKREGDNKLPGKKQDLIARYLETCRRGNFPPQFFLMAFNLQLALLETKLMKTCPPPDQNS
jgi:hypothetical protein